MEPECCWTKETVTAVECPFISPDETDLYGSLRRRLVARCLECPLFSADLERMTGEGRPEASVLRILRDEFLLLKSRLDTMIGFLDSRNMEIQFLHEIGALLQTSLLELDEVLSVALTAITAGKGFGMNRAFLLLADKERRTLKGSLAVGPRTYEEAWEIWEEIGRTDFSLKEMAKHFHDTKLSAEKDKFHDILERLAVPMDDTESILIRSLQERRPILVQDAFHDSRVDPDLAHTLGVDSFLILPLLTRNRRIGVIIADNFITKKPITLEDMRSMETITFPVAFAIERAALYDRLHEDLRKLMLANTRLKEQQELIVRLEKMALLGKVTSSIAHSIRNPLMIIGGFARSLLKNIDENDPNKEFLETIVREARQLEDTLSEALGYADSMAPVLDRWDINELVGNVFAEVQSRAAREGVTFTIRLAPDLPMIRTDYRQMAYCIKRILLSSLDAVTPPAQISVATRGDGDDILVEIRDTASRPVRETGEAISRPALETRTETENLELSFCSVILENYCKSFTVDEDNGQGTLYQLRLSRNKEEERHE
ncbi:MAG: GAF domain-containing protein [Geobacteraceae bacterium]|nr:GAF domain-containing protein [Geobacteraceae bacterium]